MTAEHILSRLTAAGSSDLYGYIWVGKDYSKADLIDDLRLMTVEDTLAERVRCAAIARSGQHHGPGGAGDMAVWIAEEIERGE